MTALYRGTSQIEQACFAASMAKVASSVGTISLCFLFWPAHALATSSMVLLFRSDTSAQSLMSRLDKCTWYYDLLSVAMSPKSSCAPHIKNHAPMFISHQGCEPQRANIAQKVGPLASLMCSSLFVVLLTTSPFPPSIHTVATILASELIWWQPFQLLQRGLAHSHTRIPCALT
jgi:hypothetical protein